MSELIYLAQTHKSFASMRRLGSVRADRPLLQDRGHYFQQRQSFSDCVRTSVVHVANVQEPGATSINKQHYRRVCLSPFTVNNRLRFYAYV